MRTTAFNQRAFGFSVVELMVAMSLSLLLLAGVMSLFANSRKTYEANERLARLQENGRFALDYMVHDIRSAGYKGCSRRVPDVSPFNNMLHRSGSLLWNFELPVQGFEAASGAWQPAKDALIGTAEPGNDILIVRGPRRDSRALPVTAIMSGLNGTITVADPGTADLSTTSTIFIGNCLAGSVMKVTGYTHALSEGVIAHASGANPGADNTPVNSSDSAGLVFDETSEVIPVETVAYFLRENPAEVLSLYRTAGTGAAEEIIDGIEGFQVAYGLDSNGDQWADTYETAQTISSTNRWGRVVSVTLAILVRSVEQYGTESDSRTYDVLGTSYGPFNDRHQRMVFTTTASVRNQTQ